MKNDKPDPNQQNDKPQAPQEAADRPAAVQPPTHRLGEAPHNAWVREQQQMLQELRAEAAGERPQLPEGAIAIQVLGAAQPLVIQLEGELTLGRFDATHNDKKRLDLTPYNAYTLGVSRQHATIQRYGDLLTLTDLGSTNGTMVNGKTVVPGQAHPLHDGDEIILGELLIHIYF